MVTLTRMESHQAEAAREAAAAVRAAAGCKNFYRTHGFVYLPSLIPEDEVASLHTRLDELVAAELRSVLLHTCIHGVLDKLLEEHRRAASAHRRG